VLNEKADAQECLDFLLRMMHLWIQSCTTPPSLAREAILNKPSGPDLTKKFEELLKVVKCSNSMENSGHTQQCFIHEMFFLFHQQIQICSCRKGSGVLS